MASSSEATSLGALLGGHGDPFGVTDSVKVAANTCVSTTDGTNTKADPVDALSFIYQVDYSPILDQDDQPISIFHHPRAKTDIALDYTLLIGFETSLYIANNPHLDSKTDAHPSKSPAIHRNPRAHLLLLSDGHEQLSLDEDEEVTDVKWVDTERFAVSYSSGILRIFGRDGKLQFAQKFHHASITKLDMSANVSSKIVGGAVQQVDVDSTNNTRLMATSGGELWVLYDDGTVAIVLIQELLVRIRAAVYGPAQANKFRKYALRDQHEVLAAAACGPARPTIFQSHHRLGVHTVVSVGTGPFLSFYQAGNDQNSIIHLAHIATAIASRAAGAVWSFAKSWGWSTSSTGAVDADGATAGDADASGEMRAVDAAAEHVAAAVGSIRSIPEDPRRRCRMFVLSPTGRLAAISDTLGRILLVDTNRMTVIRMWKGYRYAQCGWMHGAEGKNRSRGLYLVIYSAQRGIVEVWRTRYGPRVFSFAVGDRARLFTQYDPQQQRIKCLVLAGGKADADGGGGGGGEGMAELIEIKPHAPSVPILMKYFTQNKLQEENFVLHQIIGGLQAYVKKKRADASHTLEQDALSPLLDDLANLASPTSVQALLDVLLVPDMTMLSASFVLKCLEQLQTILRNGMASRSPTGTELSLLWQLQWRQRILSAYTGLHGEYLRARPVLHAAIRDTSATLAKHVSPDDETGSARSRLLPWLELYRRTGYNWSSDDATEATWQVSARAAELTWWDFMEYFSMPFTDPELPRRRDVVALYEHTEKSHDFLREAFQVLNIPVFRPNIRPPQLATLMALLFTPVLSNVFAVQELQLVHESLFLTPVVHTPLFIEWYFSLPIGAILAIPPPSLSCAFQRWLTPYVGKWDDAGRDIEEEAQKQDKRRLSPCREPLQQIFYACMRSQRLVHTFILSEQCRWGEQQQAKAMEEATLGKYSSVDGGLRWRILQDCLAKTVHVGIRLGRLGKISVEAVENVDEILRAVAFMQLNEGYDLEHDDLKTRLSLSGHASVAHTENDPAAPSATTTAATTTTNANALDSWVASLEDCRTSVQMKSWLAVLQSFPQLVDTSTMYCFRATLLCAAWNAERSDMHQLEDAIGEVQALSSSRLQVAMGVHIWERYIRVHVVTLISFWEESAAGRKPQRGLQPQIARRFFSIIKGLLSLLVDAMKAVQSNNIESEPTNDYMQDYMQDLVTEAQEEDDNEDEDGEEQREREDEEGEHEEDRDAEVTASPIVEHLTSRRRWRLPVRDLRHTFGTKWPPPFAASTLMLSLHRFDVDRVSPARLADHLSLVLLLDSFAATTVTPVSIVKLYPEKGRDLCRPDSFMDDSRDTRPGNAIRGAAAEKQRATIHKERTQFLRQLLHHNDSLGFALAEAFKFPTDLIREEYVVFLYQSGKDELADFSFDKMKQPERLVAPLAAIARARLSLILQRMKAEPEYAMLLSILPADLCMWITADTIPPFVADPQVEQLDNAPSLTSTSMILLRCQSLMQPPIGPEFDKVSAMSVLVKDIIARVKHTQQHQQHQQHQHNGGRQH